jgi:hypothetical protein
MYFGATALTAITDNAALTYLGSLVEGVSDQLKYALVAGAVSGGGLTVIANAPNPAGAGFSSRQKSLRHRNQSGPFVAGGDSSNTDSYCFLLVCRPITNAGFECL